MTPLRSVANRSRAPARLSAFRKGAAFAAVATVALAPAGARAAATGQINKLTDVTFSALNPLMSTSSAQSVCAYSSGTSKGYSIRATGSGTGGAFTLGGGGSLTLTYGVQWSSSSGASSGATMTSGVDLTGQTSTATIAGCTVGPSTTASLIVTLAASDLQTAVTGVTYTGTLTLLLTPQ